MPGVLTAGQLVDERYALAEALGEDALGTVWRAHDRGLGRPVQLHEIRFPGFPFHEEPDRRQEALRVARLAIRVDHPRAVHVWDAFLDGTHLMVVTELVPGRSLEAAAGRRVLAPKRVASVGLDLLDALEAAHAKGVVHGSVSPIEVILPERAPARLGGFGLAPSFTDTASVTWVEAVGRPTCIAPEQANLRGSSPATDLWSLGATLYYAAEGTYPFVGSSPVNTLVAITHDDLRPPAKAGALAPLLESLLARSPEDRISAADLREGLAEVAGVAAHPEPAVAPLRRSRRARRHDEDEVEAEPAATDGETSDATAALPADHDWQSVVDLNANREPAWVDWSPGQGDDASDVWLPGGDMADIGDVPTAGEAGDGNGWPRLTVVPDVADNGGATAPNAAEAAEGAPDEESGRVYRSAPSWPPPPKRRIGATILITAVTAVMVILLVTNGRLFGKSAKTAAATTAAQRPVLGTDPSAVPPNWVVYRNAATGYAISHPPTWTVQEEGKVITIRDPETGSQLRVEYTVPAGQDPLKTWQGLESSFSSQHQGDYRRLQLSGANYLGDLAALWEFTFTDGTVPAHAVDLGFLTKKMGFAFYFEAPADGWTAMLANFQGFLSSFQPPK